MSIMKSVVSFTVYHADTYPITELPLNIIMGDADEGETISGTVSIDSIVMNDDTQIRKELYEIGNDGTFFDLDYDE